MLLTTDLAESNTVEHIPSLKIQSKIFHIRMSQVQRGGEGVSELGTMSQVLDFFFWSLPLLLPFESRKTYSLEKNKVKMLNMCINFIGNLLPERVDCPYLARTYNELLSYLKFKNASGLYILRETVWNQLVKVKIVLFFILFSSFFLVFLYFFSTFSIWKSIFFFLSDYSLHVFRITRYQNSKYRL